jgi:hypothetical protein
LIICICQGISVDFAREEAPPADAEIFYDLSALLLSLFFHTKTPRFVKVACKRQVTILTVSFSLTTIAAENIIFKNVIESIFIEKWLVLHSKRGFRPR